MPNALRDTQIIPGPPPLEEASAASPADVAAAAGFALWRASEADPKRPVAVIACRAFLQERGHLFSQGAAWLGVSANRLILVRTAKEAEVLWAMEEALKSGAVAGAVGMTATAPFVATRRLDFAGTAGRAAGVLLRPGPVGDLSAARLRWRVGSAASAPNTFDIRAPGPARIAAELVRRRNGPLGAWTLEQDDEAGGFRLAAGLADHGLLPRQSSAA
jgi:protein ImuA